MDPIKCMFCGELVEAQEAASLDLHANSPAPRTQPAEWAPAPYWRAESCQPCGKEFLRRIAVERIWKDRRV